MGSQPPCGLATARAQKAVSTVLPHSSPPHKPVMAYRIKTTHCQLFSEETQKKHAKCKYNIVYNPCKHYFPGVSWLSTALQCLGQHGTDGSNLRLQPHLELRSHLIMAPLLGEARWSLEMLNS